MPKRAQNMHRGGGKYAFWRFSVTYGAIDYRKTGAEMKEKGLFFAKNGLF
jgi:hypothetical protein